MLKHQHVLTVMLFHLNILGDVAISSEHPKPL
uniref:Uncharacterized protein n=1 Tax=Arundo donax TaxID=35708 RepID=A0A0A9GYQ8_ARUDO